MEQTQTRKNEIENPNQITARKSLLRGRIKELEAQVRFAKIELAAADLVSAAMNLLKVAEPEKG
jgi:hypothetical protein